MTTLAMIELLADRDSWGHGDGWGMGGMMIGMGLFWGAVILGIVWLVRGAFQRPPRPREETALSLLDRRFADGALTPDDYHQRRSILTGTAVPHPEAGVRSPAIEDR